MFEKALGSDNYQPFKENLENLPFNVKDGQAWELFGEVFSLEVDKKTLRILRTYLVFLSHHKKSEEIASLNELILEVLKIRYLSKEQIESLITEELKKIKEKYWSFVYPDIQEKIEKILKNETKMESE